MSKWGITYTHPSRKIIVKLWSFTILRKIQIPYICAIILEELTCIVPIGPSHDRHVNTSKFYSFYHNRCVLVLHLIYIIDIISVRFNNCILSQLVSIMSYAIVLFYITIHRNTLSPILHNFSRWKMSYPDSFIGYQLHSLFYNKHHLLSCENFNQIQILMVS